MPLYFSELFESRHLTDLDKTTLNLLSTMYKKKMKSSLSTRIITPHYIPGLDFDQVSRTSPREYIPDDNQDSGDNIRLRGKSFAKRSVLEIPPKNNVLKDRNSDHKMLAPVEAAGDWTQVSPSGKRNGPEKRNEPLSPMVPRSVVDNICSSLKNIPPEINGKTPSSAAVSPNTSFRESDDEGCVLSPSPSSSPKAKYVAPAFRIHDGIDLTPAKVPAALSAIMEEERRALAFKLEKATPLNRPKTGSHSRHGRKFVGVKLQATDAVVEEAAGKELESTRPRSNPWNRALPVGPTFMEVMAMEEEETKKAAAVAAVTAAKTSPVVVPPSKPTLHVPSQPWSIQPAASKSTPSTSFNSISPLTSPNPVSSFLTIQREEQSQLFELQKSRSRPLHLIQAEERAVDELLEFYGARDNPEEWITVERVLPKLAAASWYPRSH
ncbi:hypothetical protein BV898_08219 [Hypsibius exemplaris]|uniref:Uncharacterized protein n=1 Tax=Hypsibius exemplaris TaxID=2072580 RepID=A0A1W0WRF9_HYPEX|nr:hypothetical protein BV898_08219 [Hypsibius exemplaris]